MPSLGPAEILVILVIALLVFGPDKMPDMARQAGRAFREFRRVQQHLRSEVSSAVSDLTGSEGAPDASTPSEATPGGDPVPMLPPKDTEVRQPDAQPPPPGAMGPAPGASDPGPGAPGPSDPAPGGPSGSSAAGGPTAPAEPA